jgi:hypothetical protein
MAENVNALILPIGADVSQFEKSIKEVKDALKSLQKEIAAKPFNLVTDQQISQLKGLESTLDRLQGAVNGTSNSFSKGEESTKKASRALNSLSLVAQDAPFGFIGIQNNLPGVITAFGQLDFKTNGLKGGLKELGASLVGPAGLFLAFSAVTAAVTFAIKEYGSLSNAVNVLFGANANAIKSQNDFNKEIVESAKNSAGQVSKINILVATIQNENTSQKDRIAAYRELKRINPDVVAGIDEQNLSTLKSIKLIGENAKAQLEFIKLQTKIAGITKALGGLEEERFAANGKYNVERKKELDLINFIAKAKSKDKKDLTTLEINTLANENNQLKAQAKNVKEASDAIADITAKQENWTNSLTPAITSISKISSNAQDLTDDLDKLRKSQEEARKTAGKNQFTLGIDPQELDAAFNLDKIISSIIKYGNALLDTNKSVEERKNALKELVAINPQVFSGLSIEKSATLANKDAIESYLRSLEVLKKEKEFNARASQVNSEFLKSEIKAQEQAVKAEEDAFESLVKLTYGQDQYGNSTDKSTKANNKFVESLGELQDIDQGVIDILTKGLGAENTYEKSIKDLLNFEEYQKASVDRIAKNFRFLQNPLEDLFGSVLEDGIANWQAFGDAVVAEIKKIVAALIAKGVIQLLASLLAPGVGSLIGGGGAALGQDAFERYFKIFDFDPQGSKVNFSGVQGGGMQMAGAVNLTLRGSDLVGSINRTNSTINRVG